MLHKEAQTEVDNALVDLLQQDQIDISLLEKLLSDGANPNILVWKKIYIGQVIEHIMHGTYPDQYAEEVMRDGYADVAYTPLHLVEDDQAIKLLLKYGANPYQHGCDHLNNRTETPLEYAAKQSHYSKVISMVTSSAVLKTEDINTTINIILNDLKYTNINQDAKNAVNILISKSHDITTYPDSFLFILLEGDDDILDTMIDFHFDKIICHLRKKTYFNLSENCYKRIKWIQQECFNVLDEMRLISLMLGFYYGYSDKNSIISSLPSETILHIGSYLCSLNKLSNEQIHWGLNTLSHEEDMQISAFKKIYTLMNKEDRSIFASHEFLENKTTLPNYMLMHKIREKISNDYDGMTTFIWQLACEHYQNCHSDNHVLMMIMTNWCINKDPVVKIIPESISFFSDVSMERKKEIYHSIKNNFDEINKLDENKIIKNNF